MKKKLLYFLPALMICASLTACGGGGNTSSTASGSTSTVSTTPGSSGSSTNDSTDGPTDEQLKTLTEAYNQVAVLYNDAAAMALDNGWLDDPETNAIIQVIADTLEPIGQALDGDISALDGADLDALPGAILEFQPELEALYEKVSVPYEGSEGVVAGADIEDVTTGIDIEDAASDEDLIVLVETYNEVAPLFNEIYEIAEANGWMANEEIAVPFQELYDSLSDIESGLTDDPSILEDADIVELADYLQQTVIPWLEELTQVVSIPYEG